MILPADAAWVAKVRDCLGALRLATGRGGQAGRALAVARSIVGLRGRLRTRNVAKRCLVAQAVSSDPRNRSLFQMEFSFS